MPIGIVSTNIFSEAGLQRVLPPEHRIIGSRDTDDCGVTDYLVEGPFIRESEGLNPHHVMITFTMHSWRRPDAPQDGVKVTGQLSGHTWTIGEWSSMDEWERFRLSLALDDSRHARAEALKICRDAHPDLPCTEPCDTCFQYAQRLLSDRRRSKGIEPE